MVASTQVCAQKQQSADQLYREGYAAYNRGDLVAARDRFAQLVRAAPKVAVAHLAYGEVLLALGQPGRAVDELTLARTLDPKTAATLVSLGQAYLANGQEQRSAEAFGEGIAAGAALSPGESRDYATSLDQTGHTDEAIAVLGAALTASGGASSAAGTALLDDALGTLLAKQGKLDEAEPRFRAAIAEDPGLASAHAHLGAVALARQQPEAAIPELKRAAELAPLSAEYAVELGRALTGARQDAEAISVLRHAVALTDAGRAKPQPEGAIAGQARYALALALQAGGHPGEALPLFAAYTAASPHDGAALTNYALALVQTGDASRAVPLYEQALAVGPDNATLREDLGVAYLQQSDLTHAIEQFRAGLKLEPENPHLHYDLGLGLKLKDDLPGAVPEFERAEALDPALPDPPYTLGVIHMQQGDFPAAAAQLEQAVALRPENGAAWAVLGTVYKQNGDAAKATDALRKAIQLQPEQPSTHITLASILAENGDRAGAAAERKTAADLSRVAVSRQRSSFALKSGLALMNEQKLAEAEAQLRVAVEADPASTQAHQALAEVLSREGRAADAAVERKVAKP